MRNVTSWMVLVTAIGCTSAVNPCRPGTALDEASGACVDMAPVDTGHDGDDASAPGDGDGVVGDASATMPQGPDAGRKPPDAGLDDGSTPIEPDAGESDASMPDAGASDGGPDDGGVPGSVCEMADVELWKEFHYADDLVRELRRCGNTPACQTGGECLLTECLMEANGLQTCDQCIRKEAECVNQACRSDCGSGTPEECRACACEHGCIDVFANCAGAEFPVCECSNPMCTPSTLDPALIMVILHPVLTTTIMMGAP